MQWECISFSLETTKSLTWQQCFEHWNDKWGKCVWISRAFYSSCEVGLFSLSLFQPIFSTLVNILRHSVPPKHSLSTLLLTYFTERSIRHWHFHPPFLLAPNHNFLSTPLPFSVGLMALFYWCSLFHLFLKLFLMLLYCKISQNLYWSSLKKHFIHLHGVSVSWKSIAIYQPF